jgi:nucleoid DNA-binding protein
MSEFIEVELEEDFFRNTKDFKNIDELLRLTYRATADVYDDTVYSIEGEYYLIDGYSVPVLFHQIGNKLIVALRGTASIANIISDLYTTNPITIGENSLDYYEFFRERINEKNDIKFHAGFIQALVYPPSKQARLGSKLESDYTPLYAMIRENIDNFKGEVTDLIFTGHSLGGALASLCYYLYQNDTYNIDEKITNSVRCVSYGSQRFVIKGGEQYYNSICPNLIRCWNESDIVTYIPFYRGIPNINIIDGFIHVGKSFCLDNPLSRADINQYVVDMLQEEKPAMRGLRGLSVEEGVNACKTISSTNYQTDLIKGLFEQLGNGVEVKSSEEIILEMESKCIRELQQGENVGKVFSGIGLETTLMEAKVGEDPRQTQFYYGSLFGYVMGTNKKSVDAHRLTTYKENIDRLIALEIKSKVDVLEQAESLQQAEKENIVEAIVKEEIKEEVEDRIRIPIIGFTEQFSGMEIISVNNNV